MPAASPTSDVDRALIVVGMFQEGRLPDIGLDALEVLALLRGCSVEEAAFALTVSEPRSALGFLRWVLRCGPKIKGFEHGDYESVIAELCGWDPGRAAEALEAAEAEGWIVPVPWTEGAPC